MGERRTSKEETENRRIEREKKEGAEKKDKKAEILDCLFNEIV